MNIESPEVLALLRELRNTIIDIAPSDMAGDPELKELLKKCDDILEEKEDSDSED